jgi:hypothetical protein
MSLYVFGTDTLSLYRRGQPLVVQRILQQSLNTLATTAITVEEQLDYFIGFVLTARRGLTGGPFRGRSGHLGPS